MAYSKTSPNYPTGTCQTEFDAVKENFAWIERLMHMHGAMMLDDYYTEFSYSAGKLAADPTKCIVVKNSGGTEQAYCKVTYSGDNIATEAWTINGQTLTYTYTYSGSDVTKIELNIT